MRHGLLETMLVLLIIWIVILIFIIHDTPMIHTIAESRSYWSWLDENCPTEDTAHYQTTPAQTAGDFYYGGTDK